MGLQFPSAAETQKVLEWKRRRKQENYKLRAVTRHTRCLGATEHEGQQSAAATSAARAPSEPQDQTGPKAHGQEAGALDTSISRLSSRTETFYKYFFLLQKWITCFYKHTCFKRLLFSMKFTHMGSLGQRCLLFIFCFCSIFNCTVKKGFHNHIKSYMLSQVPTLITRKRKIQFNKHLHASIGTLQGWFLTHHLKNLNHFYLREKKNLAIYLWDEIKMLSGFWLTLCSSWIHIRWNTLSLLSPGAGSV